MTYPFVVGPVIGDEAELPAMFEVRQHFDVLPAVDVLAALDDERPRVLRIFVRGHSSSSAASTSTAGKTSKCCRTSNMAGSSASSPTTGATTNGYVIPTSRPRCGGLAYREAPAAFAV